MAVRLRFLPLFAAIGVSQETISAKAGSAATTLAGVVGVTFAAVVTVVVFRGMAGCSGLIVAFPVVGAATAVCATDAPADRIANARSFFSVSVPSR